MPQMSSLFWLLLVIVFIKFYLTLTTFIYFEVYSKVGGSDIFERHSYYIKFS